MRIQPGHAARTIAARKCPSSLAARRTGDASGGVALENLAQSRLARHEQHVGHFHLQRLLSPARSLSVKTRAVAADGVDDGRRERVSTHVHVDRGRREIDRRRIVAQRHHLRADHLPGPVGEEPGVGAAIARMQHLAVVALFLIGDVGRNRDASCRTASKLVTRIRPQISGGKVRSSPIRSAVDFRVRMTTSKPSRPWATASPARASP